MLRSIYLIIIDILRAITQVYSNLILIQKHELTQPH